LSVDTPETNDIAKKTHRHILGTTRSFILSTFVPHVFWDEVVLIVVDLMNTILSFHISGFSPFKKLYRYTPDYSFF
jgi:hypothetical protein